MGTRFGLSFLILSRVRDLDGPRTFVPIWGDVGIDAGRIYQEDVTQIGLDLVQRVPYRVAVQELQNTIPDVMSPRTLHRRVLEAGERVAKYVAWRDLEAQAVLADGTKLPMGGHKHHDLNVSITVGKVGTQLRGLTVDQPWLVHRGAIEKKTTFHDANGNPARACIATKLLGNFRRPKLGKIRPALTLSPGKHPPPVAAYSPHGAHSVGAILGQALGALPGWKQASPPAAHEATMVIRKMRGERRWRLYSRKTDPRTGRRKVLGTFASRAAALRRERQIQFFKRRR